MAKVQTLEDLLTDVRLRGGLNKAASNSVGQRDVDLELFINDEMDELVTHVLTAGEEFFMVEEKLTPVASQSRYRINPRSMYQKVDKIYYRSDENSIRELCIRIDDTQKPYSLGTSDAPRHWYIEGNHIRFVPDMGGSPAGFYEVTFLFKPGKFVQSTNARQVQSVSTTSITLTSAPPASWTTGTIFDIHSQHSGAEIKQWSLTSTNISGSVITFGENVETTTTLGRFNIEAGDWVCLEEEIALAPLPTELHKVLAEAAVVRVHQSLNNMEKAALHEQKLNRMLEVVKFGINVRSDIEQKVVPTNSVWNWVISD